jgi:hypothetical protein
VSIAYVITKVIDGSTSPDLTVYFFNMKRQIDSYIHDQHDPIRTVLSITHRSVAVVLDWAS